VYTEEHGLTLQASATKKDGGDIRPARPKERLGRAKNRGNRPVGAGERIKGKGLGSK